MTPSIHTVADEFAVQARRLIDEADKVEVASFRKVLYLVMIDALAKIRFPELTVLANRDRFVSLVREFRCMERA